MRLASIQPISADRGRFDAARARRTRQAVEAEDELEREERCLIVEDVVTTGGSTIRAIDRVREEGLEIVGVVSVLDRLAGGAEAIEAAAGAPYVALTTIDDVYPERPDS